MDSLLLDEHAAGVSYGQLGLRARGKCSVILWMNPRHFDSDCLLSLENLGESMSSVI